MEKFKKDVFKKTKSSKHIFSLRNLKRLTALFLALITIVTTYTGDWKFLSFNGLNRVLAADDTSNKEVNITLENIPTGAAEESGKWTLTYKNSNGEDKTAVKEAVTISSETAPSGQYELLFDIGEDELNTAESMSLSYEKTETDTNGFILRFKDSITVDGNSIDGYTADVTNVFDSEKYDKYFSYKAEIADAEGYMDAEDLVTAFNDDKKIVAEISDGGTEVTQVSCAVDNNAAVISGVVKYDENKTYTLSITDTAGNFAFTEKQISVSSSGNVEESSIINLARATQDYTVSLKNWSADIIDKINEDLSVVKLIQKDEDGNLISDKNIILKEIIQQVDVYNFTFEKAKSGISYALSIDLGTGYVPYIEDIGTIGTADVVTVITAQIVADTTAPVIEVTYNGNENSETYYKKDEILTATIKITEENLDTSDLNAVKVKVKNEGNAEALNWTRTEATADQSAYYTAEYKFDTDGVYQVIVECTDKAGNAGVKYEGKQFTVDRTAPVIEVKYNCNNDSSNSTKDYYKIGETLTATIKITEENLDTSDLNAVKVKVKNGGDAEVLNWTRTESTDDQSAYYTAEYNFAKDGVYQVSVECTDKAGNAGVKYEGKQFTVDRTAPEISDIEYNAKFFIKEGDIFHRFYQEKASIKITVTDDLSGFEDKDIIVTSSLKPSSDLGDENVQDIRYTVEESNDKEYIITISAPDSSKSLKGNYFIKIIATDKAGNSVSKDDNSNVYIETEDKNAAETDETNGNGIFFNVQPASNAYTKDSVTYYNQQPIVTMKAVQKFSGIKSITYGLNKYNTEKKGYDKNNNTEDISTSSIVYNTSRTYGESGNELSDGQYKASFWFTSNAGYSSKEYSKEFVVDTTAPVIEVTYKCNNDSSNSTKDYYKIDETLTATIKITEENLDTVNGVKVKVKNEGDAEVLNWTRTEATADQPAYYTAEYNFNTDGVYQVSVECTDKAGNAGVKYEGKQFTVDRTAPVIEVKYNGNENPETYYKKGETLTATIKITEENLDTVNGVKVKVKNEGDAEVLNWTRTEATADQPAYYTAEYDFNTDGVYQIIVECTDKAENAGVKYEGKQFTVDRTEPEISDIEYNDKFFIKEGDIFHRFYQEKASIKITVTDDLSGFEDKGIIVTSSLKPSSDLGDENDQDIPYTVQKIDNDKKCIITISAPDSSKSLKGNYFIKIIATDKAGNSVSKDDNSNVYIETEDKNAAETDETNGNGIFFNVQPASNAYTKDSVTYYNQQPIVTMKAVQKFSGIKSITYGLNKYNAEKKGYDKNNNTEDISTSSIVYNTSRTYGESGNELSDGQYKASFWFTSNAGYSSKEYSKEFVVDTEAPDIKVTYNGKENPETYYKEGDPLTVKIEITEKNLETTEVDAATNTVKINKLSVNISDSEDITSKLKWTKSGDKYTAEYDFAQNGDGEYQISVKCTDKAGNEGVKNNEKEFTVDRKAPVIEVKYNSNENPETYYKIGETLTATIKITEENLDTSDLNGVKVKVKNDGDAEVLNWTRTEATTDQPAYYTAEYNFAKDGVYQVSVECTDKAGNAGVKYEGKQFTVDRTAPVIEVKYNGNENPETYYKKDETLTATIKITEENLDTSDLNAVKVKVKNEGNAEVLNWTRIEATDDQSAYYTAEYKFDTDGVYQVSVECTDKAGNAGVKYEGKQFTVDRTTPEITVAYEPAEYVEETNEATGKATKYFNAKGGTTATITIREINFTSDNTTLKINGQTVDDKDVNWTDWENDTPNSNVYTATYKFSEDGAYELEISSTDKAGNSPDNVIESLVLDRKAPVISVDYGREPSNTENDKKYYDGQITAKITINETNFTLDKTTVTVTKDNNSTTEQLNWSTSGDIHTATYTFSDDADYVLIVETTDKATNTAASYDSKTFVIDNTNPQIKVEYNNNDAQNGNYYKADRTAIITVTEHNFKAGNVEITATKDGVSMPVAASFRDNGDEHVMEYTFSDDGDYTLTLHCTDLAARTDTYNTVDSFTVDKTLPSITIDISGVSPTGDNYFDSARTATITVNEHNFNPSDFVLRLTATDNGAAIEAPAMSSFTSSGDVHTATVIFDRDEEISISADYMDLAGNAAETPAEQKFVIDLTEPVITLDTNSLVIDKTYGKAETVTPRITVTDTNFDQAGVNIQVEGKRNGVIKTGISSDTVANGLMYTISDINEDDVYTLSVTVRDRAGRESVYSADFRVNRNGSSYTLGNSLETLNKTYVKLIDGDLYVVETNVDRLESYVLTYSRGGMIAELAEGTDYTVSVSTNSYGWQEYTYKINQSVFSEEGEYIITVNSRDIAGNSSDNTSKNKGVSFVVDKTPPTQVVTGVEDNGIYTQASLPVTVEVYDNIAVNELKVTLNGETKTYTEKEINQNSGKINIDIASSEKQQVLEVSCVDYAGNTADTQTFRFTVSTNAFITFKAKYMSKPIFWILAGCAVVAAAGGITGFIFIRKRKKEAKEN